MCEIDGIDSLFSRSGKTNPLGKCTVPLPPISIPEEMKDALSAMAFLKKRTVSEYVREVLAEHLYGRVTMVRLNTSLGQDGTSSTHSEHVAA